MSGRLPVPDGPLVPDGLSEAVARAFLLAWRAAPGRVPPARVVVGRQVACIVPAQGG